ncbi:MAG: TIGR01458 family HAD-type hydrolase [Rhodobacteraceae bacterium]|nr:TIGR01458 family HAD-type hydrolase [Paracoccaceae bacterium]
MTGQPSSRPIRGLLIDLAGVVWQGDAPIVGAAEAIRRLDAAGLPYRFVTNTTSSPHSRIAAKLERFGIKAGSGAVFTPASAARSYLTDRNLTTHFLVVPALLEDFRDLPGGDGGRAVVVGDARAGFTYDALNAAFRQLLDGAELVALAANRMFIGDDGEPAMDVGAFVAALEYASGCSARVLGKPSADFFRLAADSMELDLADVAMIGDDAEFDVGGAVTAGARGFLVRTGKGERADPAVLDPAPSGVFADLPAAVTAILDGRA